MLVFPSPQHRVLGRYLHPQSEDMLDEGYSNCTSINNNVDLGIWICGVENQYIYIECKRRAKHRKANTVIHVTLFLRQQSKTNTSSENRTVHPTSLPFPPLSCSQPLSLFLSMSLNVFDLHDLDWHLHLTTAFLQMCEAHHSGCISRWIQTCRSLNILKL